MKAPLTVSYLPSEGYADLLDAERRLVARVWGASFSGADAEAIALRYNVLADWSDADVRFLQKMRDEDASLGADFRARFAAKRERPS